MTYGYRPENWPAFQAELTKHGIDPADIERVALRPEPDPAALRVQVTVTLRSGQEHSWTHDQIARG